MDSLTHIVIGGIVGDIFAGKKLGRRAMLYGAIVQSVPDIDFVANFWLDPVGRLIAHRSITHSILFLVIVAPIVAILGSRLHRAAHNIPLKYWIWFSSTEMLLHLFLDAFNAYGTGWFEPFNSMRVSFNSIYVADPFFSIIPFIGFCVLLFSRRSPKLRMRWARISLGAIGVYLTLSVASKLLVYEKVRKIAAINNISYTRHFTTPTPFNSLLWFVVLETEKGFQIGYRSVLDRDMAMDFHFFPRADSLFRLANDPVTVERLKQFSDGFYTAELRKDTLIFNDLRFGQQVGWYDPRADFAFYYYINDPSNNELVVQRGRFARWNRESFQSLFRKIAGKD